MKYVLILFTICLYSCGTEYDGKNTNIYIGKPMYPKIIYNDPDIGDIVQLNDSIVVVFERCGVSKSNAKPINIRNFK